jgi:hypothetical protein
VEGRLTGNAIQGFDYGFDLGFVDLVIVFLLLDGGLLAGARRIHRGKGGGTGKDGIE